MLLEHLTVFPLRNSNNQCICPLYMFKHPLNIEIFWCLTFFWQDMLIWMKPNTNYILLWRRNDYWKEENLGHGKVGGKVYLFKGNVLQVLKRASSSHQIKQGTGFKKQRAKRQFLSTMLASEQKRCVWKQNCWAANNLGVSQRTLGQCLSTRNTDLIACDLCQLWRHQEQNIKARQQIHF